MEAMLNLCFVPSDRPLGFVHWSRSMRVTLTPFSSTSMRLSLQATTTWFHSQADVTHLRRKAPEVRLPDGSAEQQFVTRKAKEIARQIRLRAPLD